MTLHEAVKNNDIKKVKLLLKKGADPNGIVKGFTPLLSFDLPVTTPNKDIAFQILYELLEGGADPDYIFDTGEDRSTSLLWFSRYQGNYRFINQLLKYGANVNMQDNHGWTALHNVLMIDVDLLYNVRLLLNNGANPALCTQDGTTPLLFFCHKLSRYLKIPSDDCVEIIRLLVTGGSDPYKKGEAIGRNAIDELKSKSEYVLQGELQTKYIKAIEDALFERNLNKAQENCNFSI